MSLVSYSDSDDESSTKQEEEKKPNEVPAQTKKEESIPKSTLPPLPEFFHDEEPSLIRASKKEREKDQTDTDNQLKKKGDSLLPPQLWFSFCSTA